MVMVGSVGRGGLWCSVRLSAQLDILRLITRGLERRRRGWQESFADLTQGLGEGAGEPGGGKVPPGR